MGPHLRGHGDNVGTPQGPPRTPQCGVPHPPVHSGRWGRHLVLELLQLEVAVLGGHEVTVAQGTVRGVTLCWGDRAVKREQVTLKGVTVAWVTLRRG